jgi:predicted amidohydrolase YtcJ
MKHLLPIALGMVLLAASVRGPEPADLVIRGATIYTAATRPARVTALAVRGGRIAAVGSDHDVSRWIGSGTEVWDLPGRTVLPGLIDSHGHMLGLGTLLVTVDLTGTPSYDAVIEKVAADARGRPTGTWILGRGWDQNDWSDPAMPEHARLSAATPDHPVLLTRIDGHAALANHKALEIAGVTRETADPEGGRIERDAAGAPTGVLVDRAMGLVRRHIGPPEPAEVESRLRAAARECARQGLTMVHDAGIDRTVEAAYRRLLERGELPIRIYAMARAGTGLEHDVLERGPESGDRFALRAIKVSVDGALGSRGALLGEDYSDRPGVRGLATFSFDTLAALARRARLRGIQVRVHAIGDQANARTLDAFESAFERFPQPRLRWAIEHAQIVRPADIRRFARLGLIASMQSTHATSDGPWAEGRLGPERVKWSYAWRQMVRAGVRLANGSDFPVESVNPMLGLYAAITRRDLDGRLPVGGWRREERLSPDEALRSFTLGGAYAAFRERDLGSLEVGKLADLVVVDRDPIGGPPEQIPQARVLRTLVAGKTAYAADP